MHSDLSTSPVSFLCIGIDPNFIAYIFSATAKVNASLDSCRTLQEAKRKLSASSYDVYFIDVAIASEKIIVELLQEIRQKEGPKSKIAIIVDSFTTAERYATFLKKELINFVLQKPITPQQIDSMFANLFKEKAPEKIEQHSNLADLKSAYEATIYDKIEKLSGLIDTVHKNPTSTALLELKNELQKIGGSAGSFGFSLVSSLCKDLAHSISEKIVDGTPVDSEWQDSLDVFLTKLKKGFQLPEKKEPHKVLSQEVLSTPVVFFVDPEQKFLELLEKVQEQFPFEVKCESNPKRAIDLLKNESFNPNALVLSYSYPGTSVTAFDIIDSIRFKVQKEPPLLALLLDSNNIDVRVLAMQNGIQYVFHKPIYAFNLLKQIQDALELNKRHHFRVLVLDDDVDFCNFVIAILSEVGITVRAINDSLHLFETLEEFNPDLLLLDLLLPQYDGLNLLKILRQDSRYNHILIVIVTGSDESSTRLLAYSANADDILYKPLDAALLQKRVLNLAERQLVLKEKPDAEDFFGMVSLKDLTTKIHECLSDTRDIYYILVLFEVDHFSDWILQRGKPAADELLISIGNHLLSHSDETVKCYNYNTSKFAVIYQNFDVQLVEVKIRQFLTEQARKEALWNIAFNCSILPISKAFGNAQQNLEQAEKALVHAENLPLAPVRISIVSKKDPERLSKEVVLIDEDEQLLKILRTSFESHGVNVLTFTTGESALDNLLKRSEENLPSLIIAERKLSDMDGIEILIKLKNTFKNPVPFFILTFFSADKDVSEGLRQGALEYIGKPFNSSILIQKALKVIFEP